jgi:hypothetical protein
MTRLHDDATGRLILHLRRLMTMTIKKRSVKEVQRTRKLNLENPKADLDSFSSKSPFLSTRTRNRLCYINQWMNPLMIVSGIAYRNGNCRKYVLRCFLSGFVTRSGFLTRARLPHSTAFAMQVNSPLNVR